jgi:hypothetical protein
MTRVVVVSSAEIAPDALADAVSPDDEVHVVVPAVEQSRLQWLFNDEDKARAQALRVGRSIARAAPADDVDVEAKPDPPQQAIRDAIAEFRPDRIVLALHEGEDASWMEEGELDEAPREIDGVPVERIRLS